jgi:putative MFS transporter
MLVCGWMTSRNDGPPDEPLDIAGAEPFSGSLGEEAGMALPGPTVEHSPGYLRVLLWLLLAATFFEGYDGAILALVLPSIRDTFNVPESQLGVSRALIELGLGVAFFLARAGDRWGRRKLLLWSVLGYTLMTTLTAFSWDLWSFTAFQGLSRVFLGAEYAVAVTMIVEEFPKERRARVLGIFLMCSAIGAVAVAFLLLGGFDQGPLKWRTLYLIGVIPLLFLALFRRRLKETRRFEEHQRTSGGAKVRFFEPWRPEYRRTLVLVGLIHLFRSLPLYGATTWFFYFAEREAGMKSSFLYLIFIGAYGFGTLGYYFCGTLMDKVGRRPTAIFYGIAAAISAFALFQVRSSLLIGLFLILAVFFGLGMAPVTGAISTELFPTYIRNQSAAWSRNVFEISGIILGPLLVGTLGDHYTGALGSIGDTVSVLVLLFLPAVWLVWRHLPESRGRELEEIEAELGVASYQIERSPVETERRTNTALKAIVIVLVVFGAFIFGIKELGGISRRPQGAAERWLQGVSSEDHKEIAKFGPPDLAVGLFGTDHGEFDSIEVGAADQLGSLHRVPFRVTWDHHKQTGLLLVLEQGSGSPRGLKVVGYTPGVYKLPSDGGPSPGGAPRAAWPMAVASVIGLTVIAEVVLQALRRS